MMRVRRVVRNIGMWGAGLAIAAVFGVACVQPASAEEGTGNMVFFKGGFMNYGRDRGRERRQCRVVCRRGVGSGDVEGCLGRNGQDVGGR